MKITNAQINGFVNNPPKAIKLVLLHGPEVGRSADLAQKIISSYFNIPERPPAPKVFEAAALKSDPSLLEEELRAFDMFSTSAKKVILVRDAGASLTPVIKANVDKITEDTLVILTAAELTGFNSLKTLAETNSCCASIACYAESSSDLARFIKEELTTFNFTISPDALNLLSSQLVGNRLIAKSELDKLMLYKEADKHISYKDVEACIVDSQEIALTDILNDILLPNLEALSNNLTNFLLDNSAIVIVRSLGNNLRRLLYCKLLMQQDNLTAAEATARLKPPLPFTQTQKFIRQINTWNISSLQRYLKQVLSLEVAIKKHPASSNAMLSKLAIDIKLTLDKQ